MKKQWMSAALVVAAVVLGAPTARADDEGPVTIELRDGAVVRGRLLEFGKRTFRVRVGKAVVSISEKDVKRLEFGAAPKPSPTPGGKAPAPSTLRLVSVWPKDRSALLEVKTTAGWELKRVKFGERVGGDTGDELVGAKLTNKDQEAQVWRQTRPGKTVTQTLRPRRVIAVSPVESPWKPPSPTAKVTFVAPAVDLTDLVGPLGKAAGVPLVVAKSAAKQRVTLKLRDLPLTKLYPLLNELAHVTATPYAGAVYLHHDGEVLWPPATPPSGRLAKILATRWSVDARSPNGSLAVLEVLARKAGLTFAHSNDAGDVLARTRGRLRLDDASLAELLTLLIRDDAERSIRLVWSVRNGAVQIQTTAEAPDQALNARLRLRSQKGPLLWAFKRLVKRLGVDSDLAAVTERTAQVPATGWITGREALDRLAALAGGTWRLRGREVVFEAGPGSPALELYGGRSPQDVYKRLRAACSKWDETAQVRLMTRKSQLGRMYRILLRAWDTKFTDPEARRLRNEILIRHGAQHLLEKGLQRWDNPACREALELVPDPVALHAALATLLRKVGHQADQHTYRDSSLSDVKTVGNWTTGTASHQEGVTYTTVTLHFYRFGKRWYLHDPNTGIPTRGGEPLPPSGDTSPKPGPAGQLHKQAQEALRKGKPAAAVALLDRALQASPKSHRAWTLRAQARRALGDAAGALADTNRALRLAPDDAEALLARAAIYLALKRLREAKADVDRAEELAPKRYKALITSVRKLLEAAKPKQPSRR